MQTREAGNTVVVISLKSSSYLTFNQSCNECTLFNIGKNIPSDTDQLTSGIEVRLVKVYGMQYMSI